MSDHFFSDEERLIYRRGGLAFDPAVLLRDFGKAQSDLNVDFDELRKICVSASESRKAEAELAASEGREPVFDAALAELAADAERSIAELGRRMFGQKPLATDGTGWTESEGLRALLEYLRWQEELRLKLDAPPSGSPATDGRPAE